MSGRAFRRFRKSDAVLCRLRFSGRLRLLCGLRFLPFLLLFFRGLFGQPVAARRHEFGDQTIRVGARHVEPLLVYVGDLHEVLPLRSVQTYAFEPAQVQKMAVVTEESAAAEERKEPFHPLGIDAAYRGDLPALYLGDVQQTAHLDLFVRNHDVAGNRQRHQGDERHDERREPGREITSLVEVVQQAAQQSDTNCERMRSQFNLDAF